MKQKRSAETLAATARILIRRPPAEVFDAFADGEKMGRFWFTRNDRRLRSGETVVFCMSADEGAFSFDVRVTEVTAPDRIVFEWGGPDQVATQVTFSFDETDTGDTLLAIRETGFGDRQEDIIDRLLDSTGGFNQVVIAAKAFVEHGAAINVVADHA